MKAGCEAHEIAGVGLMNIDADITLLAVQHCWPARQITINSGEDGSVVVGRILENDTYDYGFDAQTSEFGDLERLCRSSKTGPRLRAS